MLFFAQLVCWSMIDLNPHNCFLTVIDYANFLFCALKCLNMLVCIGSESVYSFVGRRKGW